MRLRLSPVVQAHAALLACAVIYSGWNIIAARCLAVVSPITFSVVRELASIVVLYAWAAWAEGPLRLPPPGDRWRFALLGFILAAFQLCFAVGVALAGAQTAAIFQCIEPSTAAVLGALVGAEPPTWAKVLSALLAGGGVLLMQLGGGTGAAHADSAAGRGVAPGSDDSARVAGSVLLFLQGVGISCYCLLQKSLVRGVPEPLELSEGALYAEAGQVVVLGAVDGGGGGGDSGGGGGGDGVCPGEVSPAPPASRWRRFSARECARLQGFSEAWKLHPQRAYSLFGNAIPPPVVAMVAAPMLRCCGLLPPAAVEVGRARTCSANRAPEGWEVGWAVARQLLLEAAPRDGGRREALRRLTAGVAASSCYGAEQA